MNSKVLTLSRTRAVILNVLKVFKQTKRIQTSVLFQNLKWKQFDVTKGGRFYRKFYYYYYYYFN